MSLTCIFVFFDGEKLGENMTDRTRGMASRERASREGTRGKEERNSTVGERGEERVFCGDEFEGVVDEGGEGLDGDCAVERGELGVGCARVAMVEGRVRYVRRELAGQDNVRRRGRRGG